jgi:dihydrolipoamide dehydrogenase
MLAHTAYREAEVVVNTILGKKDTMRYHANPSVIYTQPEIAACGLTEEDCKAQGIEYEVQKLSMRYSGRFVAENEGGEGFCKILVGARHGEIIGVHMMGNTSSEIIYGCCLAIEMEMTVEDLKQIIYPHPTVSEIIKESVFAVK